MHDSYSLDLTDLAIRRRPTKAHQQVVVDKTPRQASDGGQLCANYESIIGNYFRDKQQIHRGLEPISTFLPITR